jgi:hypothetical protein
VKGHPTPSITQDTAAVIAASVRSEVDKVKQEIRNENPAVAKPATPQKVPSPHDTPQVHTQHMQPPASYIKSTMKAKNQQVPAASNSQALTEPSFWDGWQ